MTTPVSYTHLDVYKRQKVGFLQFAGSGALGRKEEITRQLHGERGGALDAAMTAQIVDHRSGDAQDVDAPVRLEALVFN